VEHQILNKLIPRSDGGLLDIVVLMDIPDLRLPPQSESRLLEYLRSVAFAIRLCLLKEWGGAAVICRICKDKGLTRESIPLFHYKISTK
jgi:hypothetical protein